MILKRRSENKDFVVEKVIGREIVRKKTKSSQIIRIKLDYWVSNETIFNNYDNDEGDSPFFLFAMISFLCLNVQLFLLTQSLEEESIFEVRLLNIALILTSDHLH
ncbi:RNA-binding protein Musashi Rbp6-like [Sarcoptes scabiei]|nr:RNA-binding protein Musashi Rbp6-like [Sarcoptes scabiei]